MKIVKIISPIHYDVIGDEGKKSKHGKDYVQTRYLVDIEKEHCTCHDWRMTTSRMVKPSYKCKHIKFVLEELHPRYKLL